MAYIQLEPKSSHTINYFQPFKLVLFHVIPINIKSHQGFYYRYLLNNYLFNYLNFLGLTLLHYKVKHKVDSPYYSQTNGQAKVSNWEIKKILEKIVSSSRKNWSAKLDNDRWTYQTTMKTPIGLSPF